MRVLFLIPELGYGGAETALLCLVRELNSSHHVTIVVFKKDYQVPGYSSQPLSVPCPVVELDTLTNQPTFPLLKQALRWQNRAIALNRLKKSHDVSISFLGGANLLNAFVCIDKPTILSERGSKKYDTSSSPFWHYLWTRFLDPFAYSRACAVVSVSWGLTQEINHTMRYSMRSKVHTFSGYLDPDALLSSLDQPIEPQFHRLSTRPLLVAAGRLHYQKGFQFLIPIFADVASEFQDAALLLIGDGPLHGDLVQLAQRHGLRVSESDTGPIDPYAQIYFLGYRKNPARYAQLGRAFVFPSLYEGLPNILLEALVAGAWCLAADCPWGPSEIMTHPDFGQLLPPIQDPANHDVWRAALLSGLKRPSGFSLDEDRRREILDKYSIKRTALQWHKLICDMASKV